MTPFFWLVASFSYATLPACIAAIAYTAPQTFPETSLYHCVECGYSRRGLAPNDRCPECGAARWVVPKGPGTLQRIAVALLGPGIAAMVAATVTLLMRPADELAIVVCVALAPYVVPALIVFFAHRRDALAIVVTNQAIAAGVCSMLLSFAAWSDWSAGPQAGDIGWPITAVILLSLLYAVVLLVNAIVLAVFVSRRGAGSG